MFFTRVFKFYNDTSGIAKHFDREEREDTDIVPECIYSSKIALE